MQRDGLFTTFHWDDAVSHTVRLLFAHAEPGCYHCATQRLLHEKHISYLTTAGDLLQTFETAYRHCKPGGCALLLPDCFQDTFVPGTAHGGTDGNGRGMRYLEWTHAPAGDEHTIIKDFALLLRDESGKVTVEHDRHILGLFSRADWLNLLGQAGFQAEILSVPYREQGIDSLFIIYAKK